MNDTALSQRHWLRQPRFRALFTVSAGISALLLILGAVANVAPSYWGGLFAEDGTLVSILGLAVGLTGASAALYLWIGMSWYWLRLDSSAPSTKKFWFVILLLLNWVGAIAYYLVVYRKSVSGGTPK